jgi:hypothetical protein
MIGMRRPSLLVVGMLVVAFSVLAVAQTKYSVGTVEKVSKVPAKAQPTASGDQPLVAAVDTWEISVRVGSTLYVVEYDAFGGADLSGAVGRKFEVSVQRKTLRAKTASGRVLRLPIVRSEAGPSTK